jgi:type IV pilus assembly protein PilB
MVDPNKPRKRLGDLLVAAGAIDAIQLQSALGKQKQWGRPLGATLVEMDLLDESVLIEVLADQLGFPVVELTGKQVSAEVLALVPGEVVRKWRCLPLITRVKGDATVLYLCMDDPCNLEAIDEIGFRIDMQVQPVLAAPSQIQAAIERHYGDEKPPDSSFGEDAGGGAEPESELGDDPEFIGFEPADDVAEFDDGIALPELEASGSAPSLPPQGTHFSNDALLRAIAQLLVERGIFTREELIERLTAAAESRGDA